MKRRYLIEYLREYGCVFIRQGGGHTVIKNPANNKQTAVPRHREVQQDTVRRICKQLDIPEPSKS